MHDERKVSSERADRMKAELDSLNVRLEEERRRSAELLLQVNPIPHKANTKTPKQLNPTSVKHTNKLSCLFCLKLNVLQKSLLHQNEEQRRIAALEQQVIDMLRAF